jgi:hypothetical protein
MPDSATSDQEAATAVDAGLDAGGQEAGRVNGIMKTLGKRTSERDEAIAERDHLREELAAMTAEEPAVAAPGPPLLQPQLPEPTEEADEAPEGSQQPQPPPPEYELPAGSVVTTPDGSQYLVGMTGPGFIAPTSPSRSIPRPSTELAAARQRFAAELPGAVADMQERALLRGR